MKFFQMKKSPIDLNGVKIYFKTSQWCKELFFNGKDVAD